MAVSSTKSIVHQAYRRLHRTELVLFLKVRNLAVSGTDAELAARLAQFDIEVYGLGECGSPNICSSSPSHTPPSFHNTMLLDTCPSHTLSKPVAYRPPDLPIEILADIMDHLEDWELSRAVGVPTSSPRPPAWSHASAGDCAMLTGSVVQLKAALISPNRNTSPDPTGLGAAATIRFGYINVLEYILRNHPKLFKRIFDGDIIPIMASEYGRVGVLRWWNSIRIDRPSQYSVCQCIDGASRRGQVDALDWWLHESKIQLSYTDAALESASARGHVAVLDWWLRYSQPTPEYTNPNLPLTLKYTRVMDIASTAGHVPVLAWWAASGLDLKLYDRALHNAHVHVLEWWRTSGLPLYYDQDALVVATRYNRPEVLDWWDKSGLGIQYRMCDIEEALEDALGGGEEARMWWKKKLGNKGGGLDFGGVGDREWVRVRGLN